MKLQSLHAAMGFFHHPSDSVLALKPFARVPYGPLSEVSDLLAVMK